ncbi:ABC transporter ATP-binding protein [Kitasatospora sp. NPDC096147]|uniref:ABC transporter ATP-binding protein n=1 Tax=Kitasatospora sp. NPDC096147 TaxID=3364093 RepID=UPI00381FB3CB
MNPADLHHPRAPRTSGSSGTSGTSGSEILRTTVRRNAGAMVRGTVLMGLYQAGETAFPIALGLIVEHTLARRSLASLTLALVALAAIITTVSLSWRFGMRIIQRANTTEAHRWRVRVAARALQPVAPETGLRSGEVLVIATEDADQTADVVEVVPVLIGSLVAVAITAVALGTAHLGLGALVVVGSAAILAVLSVLSGRIGSSTKEQQARVAQAGAKVADLINGLRPLNGFGGNHAAFLSYRRLSTRARDQAVAVARINGTYAGTALALNAVLAVTVALTAGWLALRGRIGIGELVMAVGLAQFVMEPLTLCSNMPKYLVTARASAERMALVLAAPPTDGPVPPAGAERLSGPEHPHPGGGVELEGLRYGALQGLGLRFPAGEFTAVLTHRPQEAADLVSVLALHVPPDGYDGVVRLGGRPLAELPVDSVRARLLVNPHHGEVFAGTLRSNIDPSGTSGTVPEAVRAAMLTDVVALHSRGLDHEVRDRGSNLSGGQRQRLSLARALAADSEVLVLHDPTTAVDAVTEGAIARRLAEHRRGRTTIVITSSPALLDAADRVYVLSDGAVRAEGTHQELLADDEGYALAVAR